MRYIEISFPTSLDNIKDTKNDNIDVFIKLEDGNSYTVTVSTPQNYYSFMEKEHINFIPAMPPDIIVKELTETNIRDAIQTYCEEDAFWLKLYYLLGIRNDVFDIQKMNNVIQEMNERLNEL